MPVYLYVPLEVSDGNSDDECSRPSGNHAFCIYVCTLRMLMPEHYSVRLSCPVPEASIRETHDSSYLQKDFQAAALPCRRCTASMHCGVDLHPKPTTSAPSRLLQSIDERKPSPLHECSACIATKTFIKVAAAGSAERVAKGAELMQSRGTAARTQTLAAEDPHRWHIHTASVTRFAACSSLLYRLFAATHSLYQVIP